MIDLDTPPKHCWPRSLLEIAENLGDEMALLLWQAYPGVHVHVPNHMPEDHALVKLLGLESAIKLSVLYGGTNLQVAKAFKGQLVIRNFIIRKASSRGTPHRDLALKHNLSERQVITICNAKALIPAMKQVDLFAGLDDVN